MQKIRLQPIVIFTGGLGTAISFCWAGYCLTLCIHIHCWYSIDVYFMDQALSETNTLLSLENNDQATKNIFLPDEIDMQVMESGQFIF